MLMDSDTNFMLVYLDKAEARHLKQWLVDNHGMLIRDASNFHGLDSQCFRVAAQTPAENDALVNAIAEFMRGTNKHFTKYW
jgi:threonine-phosphate decarboxylase